MCSCSARFDHSVGVVLNLCVLSAELAEPLLDSCSSSCCGCMWLHVAAVVACGCCGCMLLLWLHVAAVVACCCCGCMLLLLLHVAAVAACGCCGCMWLYYLFLLDARWG